MWKRRIGTFLFSASTWAATLGVARMLFGAEINSPSGHSIPLGSSDLWVPFGLAIALFALAAAIRPSGPPLPAPLESPDEGDQRRGTALGAGLPDLEQRAKSATPVRPPGHITHA